MRSKARVAVVMVTAVALLMGAGLAWQQRHRARQADEERSILAQRRRIQEVSLRGARARGDQLEQERQRLTKETEQLRGTSTGNESAALMKPSSAANKMTAQALELSRQAYERQKDPAVQLRQLQTAREKLATDYAPLFRQLGFTPVQAQQFLDVASRHHEQVVDLSAVAMAQNVNFADPIFAPLSAKIEADYQVELRSLVGEENYPRVMDYDRSRPVRQVVSGLAGAAVMQGLTLTNEQSEQLVQALAEGSKRYREGEAAYGGDEDWEAVDAKAAAILSPAQLELFKNSASSGRYSFRFTEAVMRAHEEEKKAPGSP